MIYGLKQIAQDGIGWLPVVCIAAGLVVGVLFVHRQRTLIDPLLDLRLFRIPAFSASLAINTSAIFVGFGSFLFIAQYLQLVLGLSPLEAGLWSVPGAIAGIAGSNVAPVLVRRIRPAFVIALGMVFVAIGFGMIALIGTQLPCLSCDWEHHSVHRLRFYVYTDLRHDYHSSSARACWSRVGHLGDQQRTGWITWHCDFLGSLGLAIYRSQIAASVPPSIPAEAVKSAQETLGGALATAGQLGHPLGTALLNIARELFAHALQVTSVIGFVVVIGLGILAIMALRNVSTHNEAKIEMHSEVEQPARQPIVRSTPEMQIGD